MGFKSSLSKALALSALMTPCLYPIYSAAAGELGEKSAFDRIDLHHTIGRTVENPNLFAREIEKTYTEASDGLPDLTDPIHRRNTEPEAFPAHREDSGFVIGGLNSSALILRLRSINGVSIAKIQDEMYPGHSSSSGFLASGEPLLPRLARDNDYVRSQGLTHQELAHQLGIFARIAILGYGKEDRYNHNIHSFRYRGLPFRVNQFCTKAGGQESPFHDGTEDTCETSITNLRTQQTVHFANLTIPMIERYGFYEGKVHYRLDPRFLVENIFTFLNLP